MGTQIASSPSANGATGSYERPALLVLVVGHAWHQPQPSPHQASEQTTECASGSLASTRLGLYDVVGFRGRAMILPRGVTGFGNVSTPSTDFAAFKSACYSAARRICRVSPACHYSPRRVWSGRFRPCTSCRVSRSALVAAAPVCPLRLPGQSFLAGFVSAIFFFSASLNVRTRILRTTPVVS